MLRLDFDIGGHEIESSSISNQPCIDMRCKFQFYRLNVAEFEFEIVRSNSTQYIGGEARYWEREFLVIIQFQKIRPLIPNLNFVCHQTTEFRPIQNLNSLL